MLPTVAVRVFIAMVMYDLQLDIGLHSSPESRACGDRDVLVSGVLGVMPSGVNSPTIPHRNSFSAGGGQRQHIQADFVHQARPGSLLLTLPRV